MSMFKLTSNSLLYYKESRLFILTGKFVVNKQNKPTSCISLDKCNPFRFPNFMSRPRNLSDSGNKSPDCFSYKDKVGNAEAHTVNACSLLLRLWHRAKPALHGADTVLASHAFLWMDSSRGSQWGQRAIIHYSFIRQAVNVMQGRQPRQVGVEQRKIAREIHSDDHFN